MKGGINKMKKLIQKLALATTIALGAAGIYRTGHNNGYNKCEKKHENDRVEFKVVSHKGYGSYKDEIQLNAIIGNKQVELSSLEDFLNEFGPRKLQEIGINECSLVRTSKKALMKSIEYGQKHLYGVTSEWKPNRPVPDFNARVELLDMTDGYGPCYVTKINLTPKK
jgi:hypothetical protein